MRKPITVLGRGQSLNKCPEISGKIYVVNNFTEEFKRIRIYEDPSLEIIHVCGRKGATVLPAADYAGYNIRRVVVNAVSYDKICNKKRYDLPKGTNLFPRPKYMAARGYPPIGWGKLVRWIREGKPKSDNGNCWPTTGLFAIDLACMEHPHSVNLHLYGFDFYAKPYLIKKNRSYQTPASPKVKMMHRYLDKIVHEFDDINFYCASDVIINAPNWTNI